MCPTGSAWRCEGWPDATDKNRQEGVRLADAVEHIRWRLWHGQVQRALDLIGDTLAALDAIATIVPPTSPAASKVSGLLRGLEMYVVGQAALIIEPMMARAEQQEQAYLFRPRVRDRPKA
jgi:hypothetical protein